MGSRPQGTLPQLNAPSPHRRHRVWLILFIVLVGILVAIGLTTVAVLGIAGDLSHGREALTDARRALGAGNLEEAQADFDRAAAEMAAAQRHAETAIARAASWVPMLGNNVDSARSLAEAGVHLASAGAQVAAALSGLPDGIGSLAPKGGRLPLDTIGGLARPIGAARAEAELAAASLEAGPSSFLAPPLAEAAWDARAQTDQLVHELSAAEILTGALPRFAGREGPTRYLVVAENPAELRGTGGLWGAYSIATFRDGLLSLSPFAPIQSLPDVAANLVPPPNADYRRNYDQFGGAGYWLNLNMTPDFPSAARAALDTYDLGVDDRLGGKGRLDGVIAADPFVLSSMLELTGPVRGPGDTGPVTAETVVAFTTNEAYRRFTNPVLRKELLGSIAQQVFVRFLDMQGRGIARLRALAGAVAEGHLNLYSRDAGFEAGLDAADVTGAMGVDRGDLLSVTTNNASGSKVDFYATRRIDVDVMLGGDGEAVTTSDVSIENDAPTKGQPRYVIGPYVGGASPGEMRSLTTLWCQASCTAGEIANDGEPATLDVGSEVGMNWFRQYRSIPAHTTAGLHVVTHTDDVWDGDSSAGSYRLTFIGQTTIRPTQLRITVHAPEGTDVVWTSEPMDVEGGSTTWSGDAPRRLELTVRFQAPLPVRWWRNIGRALG